jgi:hypothetical protein
MQEKSPNHQMPNLSTHMERKWLKWFLPIYHDVAFAMLHGSDYFALVKKSKIHMYGQNMKDNGH